jgi:hypothetical protein
MSVYFGCGNVGVAQQFLNGANIIAVLQQARGKAVSKSVGLYRLVEFGLRDRPSEVFAQCRLM